MKSSVQTFTAGVALLALSFGPVNAVASASGAAGAAGAWSEAYSGPGPSSFSSITCNQGGGCVALASWIGVGTRGTSLFRSEPGVGGWRQMQGPVQAADALVGGPSPQDTASCGSPAFCMVELKDPNTTFEVTWNGGRTWSTADGPSGSLPSHVVDLTCPAAGVCAALANGTLLTTVDGGTSWRLRPLGATAIGLSCPSVHACFLLARLPGVTTSHVRLFAMTSVAATFTTLSTFADGPGDAPSPAQLTCPTAHACGIAIEGIHAVAPKVLHLTGDGGRTWHSEPLLPGGRYVGFGCGSSTTCALLTLRPGRTVDSITTRDGGAHWKLATMTTNFGQFGIGTSSALACPSVTTCVAVNPFVFSAVDDTVFGLSVPTAQWTGHPLGAGGVQLETVACTSDNECLAIGSGDEATSSDGGASWSYRPVPSLASLTDLSVSCPFATTCFVAGQRLTSGVPTAVILVSDDVGGSWTPAILPSGFQHASIVSCATTSTCLSVPTGTFPGPMQLLRSTDGGATWSAETLAPKGSGELLSAVTCATATSCEAVGGGPSSNPHVDVAPLAALSTDAGATWTLYLQSGQSGWDDFSGVSCTSAMHCVTTYAGDAPTIMTWTSVAEVTSTGGTSWSTAGALPGMQGAQVLSCTDATCIGIGQNDFEVETSPPWAVLDESTDGGATWTAHDAPANVVLFSDAVETPSGNVIAIGQNVSYGSVIAEFS
jgi:hypothetical protein